jgi:hypothetical protein
LQKYGIKRSPGVYDLNDDKCNPNQAFPYKQRKEAVKILRFLVLSLLFTSLSAESYVIKDDCPCRKKVAGKTQQKIIMEKKLIHTWKVPVRRVTLFDSIIVPPEDFGCYTSGMQQIVNYKLKVNPNPVKNILNVISFMDYSGMVKIELFNCDGKLVTTLMNEYWQSGTNVRSFNVEGKIKRGTAYVKLSTEGTVRQVEKIFVL